MTRTPPAARPARRRAASCLLAGALTLTAACASGSDDGGSASDAPSRTATSSPGPADAPDAGPSSTSSAPTSDEPADDALPAWGTTDDLAASADALLTVTGLRLGTHDGYDRVVVDLRGTGTPGWHVERSGTAVEDPTGDVVDLGGAGVLTVYLTGLGYPFDTGVTELPAGTRTGAGTAVTAAQFTGTFEGQTQILLGLTDPEAPARVVLLPDPLRVVVDVQRTAG